MDVAVRYFERLAYILRTTKPPYNAQRGGRAVRQQHNHDNPQHEGESTGRSYDGLDASSIPAPRATPPHPAGIPALADLADLIRVLATSMPVERAIAAAIERAAQLVPTARRLALYALDPSTPSLLIQLGNAQREPAGAAPRLSAELAAAETLGYGERTDRQVLAERGVARPAGATLLPLAVARDRPLGALVVEHSPAAARPDATVLGIIADTLGALLERRAAAEERQRTTRALAALPALAFASGSVAFAPGGPAPDNLAGSDGVTRVVAAEEEALRAGAHELRALAAARDCMVLVRMPSGAWSALPDADRPGDVSITSQQAEALLPALREGPITIAPEQDKALWRALAPPRRQDGSPTARIHLIAAASPDETFAVYALAESPAAPPTPHWLPLARALATAVAAGIAARHMAAEARDEARARDAYMSLVAHELRGPMTALKGYAQLLVRQAYNQPLPEPMIRSVDVIEQQSLRLSEMLGELLDASRLRHGELPFTPTEVDLGAALRRVIERSQAMYPQHAIALDLPPGPLTVTGDVARIEQVLRDLIDNAARYSPNGGEIAVSVTTSRAGEALIAVRDTGIGVAVEDRERIFEYLYRAPRTMERHLSGLGLGLYVSRHLAERMGGRLWLEATSTEPPSSGSEFRFTVRQHTASSSTQPR